MDHPNPGASRAPALGAAQDPACLHQILIVDDYKIPASIPESIQVNIDCAKALYPGSSYNLWIGEDLREFIRQDFDSDVLAAFDTMRPYSFKSDLARFCLLYHFGGVYVDLGVRLLNRLNIPDTYRMSSFRDVGFLNSNWATMQTGLLWSKPRQIEFGRAIDLILENCRSLYYGNTPLHPSGPVLLGKAMISALSERVWADETGQYVGYCHGITPDSSMWNVSYIAPDGRLVALRTKLIPGDISHLGIANGNNYNTIWKNRTVYGETHFRYDLASSPYTSERLTRGSDGILITHDFSGTVFWGPYVALPDGAYEAKIAIAGHSRKARIQVDICADGGSKVLAQTNAEKAFSGDTRLSLRFELEKPEDDIECRLSIFGKFEGCATVLTIDSMPERSWSHADHRLTVIRGERTRAGIRVYGDTPDLACLSPGITLGRGHHTLEVEFGKDRHCRGMVGVEVTADRGERTLLPLSWTDAATVSQSHRRWGFDCERESRNVELKLHSQGDARSLIKRFSLSNKTLQSG